MTKRELAEKLAERCQEIKLKLKDSEMIVKTVFGGMTKALPEGEGIEVRGFGSFHVKPRQPREGRNPRSGRKVHVGPKKVPFFKVGKELKKRIDK